MKTNLLDDNGAVFSDCKRYRYKLWRIWDKSKLYAMFLMLNPSTADETKNDPTVAKCQQYAMDWGYGGLYVCNIFAYRATDPDVMKAYKEPIGQDNDEAIQEVADKAGVIVCAWGNHGVHMSRSDNVRQLLKGNELHYLKLNNNNEPGHPLYLRKNLKPTKFKTIAENGGE